jgi:hypothetical protein
MKQKNSNLMIFVVINIITSLILIFPIIKSYGLKKGFWLDIEVFTNLLPFAFYSLVFGTKFVFDRITSETYHFCAFIFYFLFLTLIWSIFLFIKKTIDKISKS